MRNPPNQSRAGLSRPDFIVTLGVLVLLAALLLPAVQGGRADADQAGCLNNLRLIAIAMHECADDHNRNIPAVVGAFPKGRKNYGTIHFHLLPFLPEAELYKRAKGYVWANRVWSTPIKTFLCPADDSQLANYQYKGWLAVCNYAANWQAFGTKGARMPASFPDGLSNTMVFAERYQMCAGTPCAWVYPEIHSWAPLFAYSSEAKFQVRPARDQCNPALAQSLHPARITVALADGSARAVSDRVSPMSWWHACTPAGNDILGADWLE